MAVFRETKLTWKGQDYWFTPSNRLVRRMESEGIRIFEIMHGFSRGQMNVGGLAYVVHVLLTSAGADVSEDEALRDLTAMQDSGEANVLMEQILLAFVPEGFDEKKPAARAKRRADKKAKKKT